MKTQTKNNQITVKPVKTSTAAIANPTSEQLSETYSIGGKAYTSTLTPLLIYWALCLVAGLLILHDQIFSWRIPTSWQNQPLFLALAIVVTLASQIAYCIVARSDGRKLLPLNSLLFVIINGTIECFVFLAAYQLLFDGARLIFGNLNVVNVVFGILGFVIYSGFVHAFFWARLLPRHFTSEPRLQPLRRLMTPIQAAIVVVWCLYFYKTGDIWTLVLLHAAMDAVLMIRVRPPILMLKTNGQNSGRTNI